MTLSDRERTMLIGLAVFLLSVLLFFGIRSIRRSFAGIEEQIASAEANRAALISYGREFQNLSALAAGKPVESVLVTDIENVLNTLNMRQKVSDMKPVEKPAKDGMVRREVTFVLGPSTGKELSDVVTQIESLPALYRIEGFSSRDSGGKKAGFYQYTITVVSYQKAGT